MASPDPPVIFAIGGLKPDTRLLVFTKEFHVHSSILKLHSHFFRKFLDSPDKVPLAGAFPYVWKTEIDEYGASWTLTGGGGVVEMNQEKFAVYGGDEIKETAAFEKLLSAFHYRSYTLTDTDEFERLVSLADYYCCLPILSQSLYSTFFQSPKFAEKIPKNAIKLLPLACQVRNAVLLKECLIHLLGPWHESQYLQLQDRKLKKLAKQTQANQRSMVLEIQEKLMTGCSPSVYNPPTSDARDRHKNVVHDAALRSFTSGDRCYIRMPFYYRTLLDIASDYGHRGTAHSNFIIATITPLMRSDLVLDWSGAVAGKGVYEGTFLFIDLPDEDLPWDINQLDW